MITWLTSTSHTSKLHQQVRICKGVIPWKRNYILVKFLKKIGSNKQKYVLLSSQFYSLYTYSPYHKRNLLETWTPQHYQVLKKRQHSFMVMKLQKIWHGVKVINQILKFSLVYNSKCSWKLFSYKTNGLGEEFQWFFFVVTQHPFFSLL